MTGKAIATTEKSRSLPERYEAIAKPANGHTVTGMADAMANATKRDLVILNDFSCD